MKDDWQAEDFDDDWNFDEEPIDSNENSESDDDWNFEDNGLFNSDLNNEQTEKIMAEAEDYEDIKGNSPSIVPDNVSNVQVVALNLDGVTIGYRFLTDCGKFDMTKKKARMYGISGIKVEKMLRLQRKNGLLLSKGEINDHQVIRDISDCDEDCEKLVNALFD